MAQPQDTTGPSQKRDEQSRLWQWIVANRTWVFSGIGTALLAALLSYFISQSGSDRSVKAGGDLKIEKGIIQTGDGSITTVKPEAKP